MKDQTDPGVSTSSSTTDDLVRLTGVGSDNLPGFKLTSGEFSSYTRHQLGVILTILEASIPEGKQLEAAKSLVRNAIHGDATKLEEWMFQQTETLGSNFPFWSKE